MNEIALANFYRILNNADRFPMEKELAEAAIAAKDELNSLRAHPSAPNAPRAEVRDLGRFVNVIPVVMDDAPDAHKVTFDVGVQHFDISVNGFETKEEANWMRDMFLKALSKVVSRPAAQEAIIPEASSKCPVCGTDTPHSHTRKGIAQVNRAEQLREIFEAVIESWWPRLQQYCSGSYGQAPILTHKKSGMHQAQGLEDEYNWGPVQLLWEVFIHVPMYVQPPLPDDGIPDVNEALEIKRHPFAQSFSVNQGAEAEVNKIVRSKLFQQFIKQEFWHAHHVDLIWRFNGEDVHEEADWLKDLWYFVRGKRNV